MSDPRVFFGDKVRLWAVSAYAKSPIDKLGGYIGSYVRSGGVGPLLAVPPVQPPYNALFETCLFTIIDPSDRSNTSNIRRELRYGDSFYLVDEQGMSLNGKLGASVDLIGPRPVNTRGELLFSFSTNSTSDSFVCYGHSNLTLNVLPPVKGKKAAAVPPVAVTNIRRDGTKVTGGYLTSDGTGMTILFQVRPVDMPLASVTLLESRGHEQVNFDTDVYASPGNVHERSVLCPGEHLNTIVVGAWEREHFLMQAPSLPPMGTMVVCVPDVGVARIPTFALPPPPANMALQSSFAPPTTAQAFEDYSTNPPEPPQPSYFENHFPLKGHISDATICIRWQRSVVLPPEMDSRRAKADANVRARMLARALRRPTPPASNFAVFTASLLLTVAVHVLFDKGFLAAFLNDPYAGLLPLIRSVGPIILVALMLFCYPALTRYRTLLSLGKTASRSLASAAADSGSNSAAGKAPQQQYTWSITLGAPVSETQAEKLNLLIGKTVPAMDGVSEDKVMLMQILQGIRSAPYVSTARECPSGLVVVPHEVKMRTSRKRQLLDAITETGLCENSLKALLTDKDVPSITFTVKSPQLGMGDDVVFKDYYPLLFRAIREVHGIDDQTYHDSWLYALDNLPTLSVGAGRSGALFLASKDNRFLFKSCSKDDLTTLQDVLVDYAKYVCYNPSRLMKFVGLHRMHIKATGEYRYIVVALNLFHVGNNQHLEFHERYDLKGRKPKKIPEKRPVEPNRGVWKDNQIARVFNLHPHVRDQVVSVLQRDVEFLRAHDMIDYSLLCGVAENDEDYQIKVTKSELGSAGVAPMVPSPTGDEIFTLGIIDFLSRYQTWKKKTAHFFKSFLWTDDELSTVNANFYANRFSDYMHVILPPADAIIITSPEQIRQALSLKDEDLPSALPEDAKVALHRDAKSAGAIVTGPKGEKYVIPPRGVLSPDAKKSKSVYNVPVSPSHNTVGVWSK